MKEFYDFIFKPCVLQTKGYFFHYANFEGKRIAKLYYDQSNQNFNKIADLRHILLVDKLTHFDVINHFESIIALKPNSF